MLVYLLHSSLEKSLNICGLSDSHSCVLLCKHNHNLGLILGEHGLPGSSTAPGDRCSSVQANHGNPILLPNGWFRQEHMTQCDLSEDAFHEVSQTAPESPVATTWLGAGPGERTAQHQKASKCFSSRREHPSGWFFQKPFHQESLAPNPLLRPEQSITKQNTNQETKFEKEKIKGQRGDARKFY